MNIEKVSRFSIALSVWLIVILLIIWVTGLTKITLYECFIPYMVRFFIGLILMLFNWLLTGVIMFTFLYRKFLVRKRTHYQRDRQGF